MEIAALPEDLWTEILKRLSVKSVVRFGSVCKLWRSLFSTASFIKEHLKFTTQNPDDDNLIILKYFHVPGTLIQNCEIEILSLSNFSETILFDVFFSRGELHDPVQLVGSINGLVCLYLYKPHQFVLWNPAIRQAKQIKSPISYFPDLRGFCWDEAEKDFKLVLCHYKYVNPPPSQLVGFGSLHVYSANSDSWSLQHDIPRNSDFECKINKVPSSAPSATVNGVPYWQYSQYRRVQKPVIKFDVRRKEFRVVPIPDVSGQNGFLIVNWKECLTALVSYYPMLVVYCFDERCGVWSKMHNIIPCIDDARSLFGCFKYGGEIVFYQHGRYICYDHKTNNFKCLGKTEGKLLNCFSYKASLVFLRGMKKDAIIFSK